MVAPLTREFQYNVPSSSVWDALTNQDKMRQWYFPQLQKFEPAVGYKFVFADDDQVYQKEWIVTRIKEGITLAHSWAYKRYPGISEVTFDLANNDDKTLLRVTHTGFESFPVHPHFKRERFEAGWKVLLELNLRYLLEGNHQS